MLNAIVTAAINGLLAKGLAHGGQVTENFSLGTSLRYDDGAGAGQASKIFSSRRTIPASSVDDMDLSGSLENDLGDPVVLTAIKAVYVEHVSGGNPAVIGNAAANPWVGPFGAAAHTVSCPVGGVLCVGRTDAGGWPVGAGASDILRIANGAGSQLVVDVVIIGI